MYTNTEDGHFLIDHLEGTGGKVVVAIPCLGHGFKFASVVGEIVKDVVVIGKVEGIVPDIFRSRGRGGGELRG